MMNIINELNGVYSFKDAVKTVMNILHEARAERDSLPSDTPGDRMEYYAQSVRVEALEDVLQALYIEESIIHHVREHDEREDQS